MKICAIACLVGVLAITDAAATAVTNVSTNATLSTTFGASIPDTNVAMWIKQYIPTNSKKLVVLTQCYGGNMVNKFAGDPNTAVISGTSPGQLGKYGGYDSGVSTGLKPGAGTTAKNIHDAGVAGKHRDETPTTGGGLNPTNFPMEPVSTGGVVRSRHVVFYAGKPDTRRGRDTDQDARLKNNFKDEPNTTYEAVAASTNGGWDHNGSAAGLRKAIEKAGAAITNSPHPDQEQFILYVTDHGDFHVTATIATTLFGPPLVFSNFPTFQSNALSRNAILVDPGSTPGFSFFVPFHPGGDLLHFINDPYVPYFQDGGQLVVTVEGPDVPPPFVFNDLIELPFELNDNPVLGDFPGEGLVLFFPVPKPLFVDSFFDVFITVSLHLPVFIPIPVDWFSQDSGEIAKPGSPMVEVFQLVPDNPSGPFLVGWGGHDPVRLEFSSGLDPQIWEPMTPYVPGGPLHQQFFDFPFPVGMIRAVEQVTSPDKTF